MLSRAHNRLSPGKGCVDAAWVVLCCDCHAVGLLFSPFGGCCFSFLSIQFCLVQQPGAWQGLAAIPSRPFAEQAAPVHLTTRHANARLVSDGPHQVISLPCLSGLTSCPVAAAESVLFTV